MIESDSEHVSCNSFLHSSHAEVLTDAVKILVVSHDNSHHILARKALDKAICNGHQFFIFNCFNCDAARSVIETHPDLAIILFHTTPAHRIETIDIIKWQKRQHPDSATQIVVHQAPHDDISPIHGAHTFDADACITKKNLSIHSFETIIATSMRTYLKINQLNQIIAKQKEKEIELKKKEVILKDVIGTVRDILWETNANLSYIYVSRAVKEQTGMHRSDYINAHFTFNMTRKSLNDAWPVITKKIKSRQIFTNIDISRKTAKGETQYFLTSGNPVFDEKNQFQGYRGADINITALKATQFEKENLTRQLIQAQRLEAIGTLASGIAHDFNNILGGILGYAQLMQFEIKDNPTCMSYSRQIVTGCNRAKNLILQILDFSRQGKSPTMQKLANPIEIVNETVKLLKASFPSSIKLHASIDSRTGCIQAEPSQVHQAVMNLCTNARQAIESGIGTVTIEVNEILFNADHPIENLMVELPYGDYIKIAVSDTGKGIETDALDKIFNPYFTTKTKKDGTGLGLALVHGIVNRFKGAVTTATTPGKGSVFTLYFPKHCGIEKLTQPTPTSIVKGNARILFIDDEPVLVKLGQKMLTKLGYKAYSTASPVKALNLIKKTPEHFDLVITDMTMPDIHGTQLARKIKAINPNIPIVLATGLSNLNKSHHDSPQSLAAILPKPIEIKALSQTISQILSTGHA
jgi:PAS domain S-box-containing protein